MRQEGQGRHRGGPTNVRARQRRGTRGGRGLGLVSAAVITGLSLAAIEMTSSRPGPAASGSSRAETASRVPVGSTAMGVRRDTAPVAGVSLQRNREPVRIPARGRGRFDVVTPGDADVGQVGADTTFTVEVERGLPFAGPATARRVVDTLLDARGWSPVTGRAFRQVTAGATIRILVATPDTTDTLCAPLLTRGEVSCRNGQLVVINARRWAFGVPHYAGRLLDYRRYVVNHEVGHALGRSHDSCPSPGSPAPVMLQQTYGLDGCARNPWPGMEG